jgi:prepilin-type N-terminal cleavage/methylation domain-containing protein
MSTRTADTRSRQRAGYTLVELIVVLALLAVLVLIAVALVPRAQHQARAAAAADQVQGWLLIAKQRARRDRHPVGLRLQVPILTTSTTAVTSPGPTTITPTEMSGYQDDYIPWEITNISTLLVADDSSGLNAETVQAQNVTATTFTATFASPHPAGFVIRLLGFVQTLQYIEQPDDFVVTPGFPTGWPQARRLAVFASATLVANALPGPYALLEAWPSSPVPSGLEDFSGGFTAAVDWPVQPGDYLELYGGGGVHQITSVNAYTIPDPGLPAPPYANPPYPNQQHVGVLGLATPPPFDVAVPGTSQYRIIRAPRPLVGENVLPLPQGMVIDLGMNFTYGSPLPIDPLTGNIDILFAPSGAVIGRAQGSDRIILWVRDATQASVFDGEPSLVTVYGRTGFIAAQPVDPTSGNPYSYTLSSSSGL